MDNLPVIVAYARSPIGRAGGLLAKVRPDDLAANVIRGLLKKIPKLDPYDIDEVILGCAYPEAE